jgi:hypothetical protein
MRKGALPGVGHTTAARRELAAPRELGLIKSAARGVLPLGLRRQLLAGPGGVGFGVPVGDMDDRMVVKAVDRGAFAVRTRSIGAEHKRPPVCDVAKVY